MRTRRRSIALGGIFGALTLVPALAPVASAGQPPSLSGGILGQVKNPAGITQMGASVLLYNRYDQLVRQVLTNAEGKFVFDRLTPDLYSIRVTLASFVPAMRRNIAVAAGSENLLQINMATLLSSIDLVSSGPARGALMSDEWKWVLRSSQATRPVLRFLPGPAVSTTAENTTNPIFSATTGVLRVSAGDGNSFLAGAEDLGTAFAVATSIYGTARVQFSGNIGYIGNSTIPAAGFRTSYSHSKDGQSSPTVIVTVRQLYLPNQQTFLGGDSSPALRTASLAIRDQVDVTDHLHIEYGASLDSVNFLLARMNYMSPFARGTYDLGKYGSVRVGYSSGQDPRQFLEHTAASPESEIASTDALNQDLTALALLPHVSLLDARARVQRTQNAEASYQRVEGGSTLAAGVYSENVSNASFLLSAPEGFVASGDLLPDVGSNSSIFNVGNYHRVGFTTSAKQGLGDHMDAWVAVGRAGGLAASREVPETANGASQADQLRGTIHEVQRLWATVAFSAIVPRSGTRVMTTYGFADARAMMPDHVFLTQGVSESTGWNVRVRQPLPFLPGHGGRLEATAEMRNLLAQGYLPLETWDGRKALLTNSPKSVRGGLAFIF